MVDLARAEATVAPMWDRTRDVIDVRLKDAPPVGILPDPAATRAALTRAAMALAVAADSAGGARSITERTIAYMKTREQFGPPMARIPGTETPGGRPGHEAGRSGRDGQARRAADGD